MESKIMGSKVVYTTRPKAKKSVNPEGDKRIMGIKEKIFLLVKEKKKRENAKREYGISDKLNIFRALLRIKQRNENNKFNS